MDLFTSPNSPTQTPSPPPPSSPVIPSSPPPNRLFRLLKNKKLLIPLLIFFGLLLLGLLFIRPYLPTSGVSPTPVPSGVTKTPETTVIPMQYLYQDPDKKFTIYYLPDSDSYTIIVLASPFSEIRTQAEAAFLTQLKLAKTTACQKNVTVSTPRYANPEEAGQLLRLSFCAL